jgi:hypothetical protein
MMLLVLKLWEWGWKQMLKRSEKGKDFKNKLLSSMTVQRKQIGNILWSMSTSPVGIVRMLLVPFESR